jgi:hypothetical protein
MFRIYVDEADPRSDNARCKKLLREFHAAEGRNACQTRLRTLLKASIACVSRESRGSLENARLVFRNYCRVVRRYPVE